MIGLFGRELLDLGGAMVSLQISESCCCSSWTLPSCVSAMCSGRLEGSDGEIDPPRPSVGEGMAGGDERGTCISGEDNFRFREPEVCIEVEDPRPVPLPPPPCSTFL